MHESLSDHTGNDHIEIFEFYNGVQTFFDECVVFLPGLAFEDAQNGLGRGMLQFVLEERVFLVVFDGDAWAD
jgi:hypothetical protein